MKILQDEFAKHTFDEWRERLSSFRGQWSPVLSSVGTGMDAGLHPKSVWNNPELRQLYRRMGMTIGPESFSRHQEALIARIDSRPSLSRIVASTLVLVGDIDQLNPPDRAKEIAAAIAGARLVEIPECGHGSTLDQPEAVTHALIQWLTGS